VGGYLRGDNSGSNVGGATVEKDGENYVPTYLSEDAGYQKVIKAPGEEPPGGNKGVYCYSHGNILQKERRALRRLVEWFEDTYEYRELDRDEFVRIIVEKLES